MKEKFIVFNKIIELFNISSFLFDYSAETSVNFYPIFGQFLLQDLHTWLGYSAGLLLQDEPYPKVHWIQIRRKWRP